MSFVEQRPVGALVGEQPSLTIEPAAITGQRSIGPDNPMTRNNNGDGIGAVGDPNCGHSFGTSDLGRKRAIAGGAPDRTASNG